MRLGIYVDARNPQPWRRPWREHYARTLELIERAEALGIGSVWLTEHHGFEDGYLSQPLVLAAAIAARTERMRIGTAVLLLPLRRPRHVAEQAALIDQLSGGRLELGLGAGYLRDEFATFGADHEHRFQALEQGVRELRELWADPEVVPAPEQSPLPLWLGHNTEVGARRAGRLRTGLLSLELELVEPYVQALLEAGGTREEARMGGVLQLVLARDPERMWASVRPHLAAQWDSYRAHTARSEGREPPAPIDPEKWRAGQDGRPPRFSVLSAEELVDRLGEYRDSPVSDVFLWLSIAGMAREAVDEHLELLASVAPEVGPWEPAR
ncbi:MAG TPA: LLM class flavin-dependent oxidoreductase [Solirubrobacteraceae bacterium]|nr:LLM class flavin-dependent oxidoreductase [Solirubrobacteraceae bacterium]